MDIEIPELDNKGLRQFAFTVGAAIAILFGGLLPFLFDYQYPIWPWVVAGVLAAWGLIAPASLSLVYKGWMKLALLLNKITTPIILGAVFLVLIVPVGLFFRVFRRDAMNKRFESGEQSYKDAVDDQDYNDLERPF